MLIDRLEWYGFLWCFYGLSFWRHPFTAEVPLVSNWCNATFLQICTDEEKTHLHLGWPEVNTFSTKFHFLNELFLYLQLLSSYTIFPRGPECSVRPFLQQGGRKSSDRSQELNINCIDDLLIERFGWNKDSSVKLQCAYVTKVLLSSLKFSAGGFLCCFSISHCHKKTPSNSHSKKLSLCLSNSDTDHTRAAQGMLKMTVIWLLVWRK